MPLRNETLRQIDASPGDAPTSINILVVASQAEPRRQLVAALRQRGYAATIVSSAADAAEHVAHDDLHLVILALPLADADAREAVERVNAGAAGVPLVIAGTDGVVAGAGAAFELGAAEYLSLPLADRSDFLAAIGVLLGARRGDEHLRYLHGKDAPSGWDSVVGDSRAIRRVVDLFRQLSTRTMIGSTPTILVTGETGTGKGFLVKTFHYTGVRRNHPFVEVNCAAIPPSLIESELFGHERGSFTDARTARSGLFETADRGTLFLDEIASVPLDLQAKLLTAIEEKKVRRIGGRRSTQVDVQIIAATHDDLARRVKEGTFRGDLFHRLNVVAVTMPPLRERADDIVHLADTFLHALCREYGQEVRALSAEARDWIRAYPWPGNVRELRNQLERIVLLENDVVVRPEHFRSDDAARLSVVEAPRGRKVRITLPPDGMPLELLEREILHEALSRCGWNVSRAARFLSISRQTLMYRMRKHGIGADACG